MPQDNDFPIAVNPSTGARRQWNGSAWLDLPNSKAPGAAYLPQTRVASDPSENAYYKDWRKQNDPGLTNARATIAQSREYENLLRKQKTGGIYGVPVVGAVAGWADPEIRRMEALSAEQARSKRQPGEGAVSDFDAKMFERMVPSKGLPTETNEMIIRAQRAAADQALQQRQMAEWYRSTYGSMTGFQEAWDNYAVSNPVWDERAYEQGKTQLNAGRQTWRQFYGAERGDLDRQGSAAARDLRRAEGAPGSNRKPVSESGRAEYQKFYESGRYNPKAKLGAASNPFVATDERTLQNIMNAPQYMGSYIYGPDGTLYKVSK